MSYTKDRGQPADAASVPGWRLGTLVIAAAMALSACNDKNSPIKAQSEPQAQAPTTAPQAQQTEAEAAPPAAPPPSAQALYQMVAPIALYPDKLVAQILAGATYPDQIAAAESWLAQNPGLQKTALANAVSTQSWDPSIKSLTQFPNVLGQLASNLPWTTALGRAYYNEPADVMNAIQVMRNRAYQAGTLKNSRQLKVSVAPQPTSPPAYVPSATTATPAPAPVLMQPEQYIEIQPSLPDTVYVPQYNPGVVYGEPMPVYGGYRSMVAPAPSVSSAATPVVAGLLGFGAGILLSRTEQRHPAWGWNSWDMHWGEPGRQHWRAGDPPPPPRARPAVVYNNTTYVSQSHTVVQNIRRTDNLHVTNIHEGFAGAAQAPVPHEPAWHDKAAMPPPLHPLAEASAPSAGQHAAAMAGAAGAGGAALAAGAYAMRRPPPPALAQDTRPPAGAQTAQGLPGREPASSTMRPATSLAAQAPRGTPVPAPGAVRPDNGRIATPRPMPPFADTHAGTDFPSGQARTPAMQQMQDPAQQRQARQQDQQTARLQAQQAREQQQMQAQRQAMQQDRQAAQLQAQQAREQQQMQMQRQAMQQDRQTARLQAQQAREQQQMQAQHQAMQQEQQMARLQAQQAREQQQIQAQRQAMQQQEQQMARAQAQQQERQAHMQAQARAQQDQQMRSQQRQQQMAAGHAERQHGERNRREQH